MAKVNPVRVKQDADKLEKAGKFDQAILLFRQLVEDNPRDWNTIKKIGDLFVRLNKNREAIAEYAKVAEFYAKDGFLLKAIAIWKQINKLDPSALEPSLNLADLYAKQGLLMEAKSQYQVVVDEYIKRGKMRDAGDVLKKMADIDAGDLKIRSKLADLYTREGNVARAVDEHIAIAEELYRKGHLAEAFQVLEKGLKIDPRGSRLRSELARIHMVQKNFEKAAQYLEEAVQQSPSDALLLGRLGEAYLGARKAEEAEAIFRRLLELNPADQESQVQIGRIHIMQGELDQAFEQLAPLADQYVDRKEGDKAAALLQSIVQKDPGHVPTLVKLAEIYQRLEKDAALVSTCSQLTEAYVNRGQMAEAAAVLERLLVIEPQNQQHKTKLQFVRSKLKPGAVAPPPPRRVPPPLTEIEEEEFDLSPADEAPAFDRGVQASAAAVLPQPGIELSGPQSAEDKEFTEEHLAEGRVFRKYGLIDKAADQFEAVVARFPDNAEARLELRDLHKERGLYAQAAEQCLALAVIYRLKGDEHQAAALEEEGRSLAPDAAAPAPGLASKAAPPVPRPTPAAAGPAAAPAEDEEEEITLGDEEIPLEVEEEGLEATAAEPASAFAAFNLDDEVSGDLPPQFIDEEPRAAHSVGAPEQLVEADEERGEPPFEETLASDLASGPGAFPLDEPAAPPSARPASALGAPPELQKVLDEVDSYLSLGFVDDAREALIEVATRHPRHAAVRAKLAELGIEEVVTEAAPSLLEPPPEPASELLHGAPELGQEASPLEGLGELTIPEPPQAELTVENLGSELGDLFDAQSTVDELEAPVGTTDLGDAGLADIFKEFKKGVDKQLGKEDYDTRYNLGIAYKEMGLVDEAIAEFQLAAKDEGRLLECSSMLGICFLEKGMPKLAIKWFEKGLKAPGRGEEEYQGLRYDLGMAYEADGDIDKALALFTDLYGQNANFRDVASKVRELRAAVQ